MAVRQEARARTTVSNIRNKVDALFMAIINYDISGFRKSGRPRILRIGEGAEYNSRKRGVECGGGVLHVDCTLDEVMGKIDD